MWADLRPALIITRREVRDQLRDWRIIVPIMALTLLFPWIMNFTARQLIGFVQRYGAPMIGERLIPFLLMVVGFFPISISLVIALESFVGEKERHSIEPLLSSPLNAWQLYVGKLLASLAAPLLASYLGIVVYLIGVYRQVGWQPEPILLVQIVTLTTVQGIVMVSGAVVVSAQTTSVRAANLLASFIIIPMTFLIQGESVVMFWARYDVLWWAILGQIVIAGLLLRTGVAHFNREGFRPRHRRFERALGLAHLLAQFSRPGPFAVGLVPPGTAQHAPPADHPNALDGYRGGRRHAGWRQPGLPFFAPSELFS